MDWRKYFTVAVDFEVEKGNPHHDKKGRFARRGAYGPASLNLAGVTEPFHTLPSRTRMSLVQSAIRSLPGYATPSSVMFAMSQMTGQKPTKEMADGVSSTLRDLQRTGAIKVTLSEHTMLDKSGRAVLKPEGHRVLKTDASGNVSIDYEASKKKVSSYTIENTSKAPIGSKKYDIQTTGNITRPTRYAPNPGSPAETLVNMRAKAFDKGASRTATMGRYFSTDPRAPENTHTVKLSDVTASQKLMKDAGKRLDSALISGDKKAITKASQEYKNLQHAAAVKKGIYESKQISRETQYRHSQFYDATSSVNGIIGTMTGNKQMLQNSRLQSFGPENHPHAKALVALGVNADNAHKPYFANTMTNAKTGKGLSPSDFKGFGSAYGHDKAKMAADIKAASKAMFTPGTYGSNINPGEYIVKTGPNAGKKMLSSGGAAKAAAVLRNAGMSHEDAHATAQKMAANFQSSPLHSFNGAFRGLISTAPEGFVYTNPMSGYRMTFDKHKATESAKSKEGKSYQKPLRVITNLKDTTGKTVDVSIPYIQPSRNSGKTGSGAAALFVQNWDSAVISHIATKTKNPNTLHDAIAIPKNNARATKALHEAVAEAYNKVAGHRPVDDLARQMKVYTIQKFKAQIHNPTPKQRKALVKKISQITKAHNNFKNIMYLPNQGPGIVNVPSNNNHFVEE